MVKPLSFSEQYQKLNEIKNYDEHSISLWLKEHPESTLILIEVLSSNPSLIFSLKNIEPEFIWWAIERDVFNLLSITAEELKEKVRIIFENNDYFQKNKFLREFLFLALIKEIEKYINGEKKKKIIRIVQHELNAEYNRSQIKANKTTNSLVKSTTHSSIIKKAYNQKDKYLVKLIEKKPEIIANIPNPNKELCELAIKTKPSVIQFIKHPTKEFLDLAIALEPKVLSFIQSPSEELCWLAILTNPIYLLMLKNPSLNIQRYTILRNWHMISHVNKQSEMLCWLALQINCWQAFEEIKQPTDEMFDYALNKEPYLIKKISEPSLHHWDISLKQDLSCMEYYEGNKAEILEKALSVSKQKNFLTQLELSCLVKFLPNDINDLRDVLNQLEGVKEKFLQRFRFELPNISERFLERLLTEFPESISFNSHQNSEELTRLALLENCDLIEKKDVVLKEEVIFFLYHLISGETPYGLRSSFRSEKTLCSLYSFMNQLLEKEKLERPEWLKNTTKISSQKYSDFVEENPLNLAFIPLSHRNQSICRLACSLNPMARIFSPYHFQDFLEEEGKRLKLPTLDGKTFTHDGYSNLPF